MNDKKNVRVAFVLQSHHWLGGKIYFRNLFAALQCLPDSPITPVVFAGSKSGDLGSQFPGVEIVRSAMLDQMRPVGIVKRVISAATSRDPMLQRLLLKHQISVLSHSFHLGQQRAVKTIGWIPDFQHVFLPDFFTYVERRLRDRQFHSICKNCDAVVVSSECARQHLKSYAADSIGKSELLRFVAIPALDQRVSLGELEKAYSFDGPYFLLPNQFWTHKNHRVVIDALALLKRENEPFLVLATGPTNDYRNPAFFSTLMKHAANRDVVKEFRVLGHVPFDHLACLMRHAVAFINPSKFEGWSTSVEEAKSLGKQIVLSDIPVHLEQAPGRGFYFSEGDPEALAVSMRAARNQFDLRFDAEAQEAAQVLLPERKRRFGESYWRIVEKVLGR